MRLSGSVGMTIEKPSARIMRELPRIGPGRPAGNVADVAEFFGRTHEVEVIHASLARARRERGPTVVVVDGEPGVGKSRLIDEASRSFPADRLAVSAYEPEMSLPFSLGHDLAQALARSSPAAGNILDPILEPEPGGPQPDWSSVFEAAHRAAGVRESLLISIDDFQWSDERSTALIHYLVRGARGDGDPLALVVAGRRSIALGALVSSLERLLGDRLTRVSLGPLDHRSTVALARAVNPALDPRAATAAADRSGGSPFWCELLARARNGDADVARIVADRLSTASTDAALLVETIAVLGRQAPVEDLIAIRGWPEPRLRAARMELLATGLVVEEGAALRIVHDLVRSAVEAQIPEEQRREIDVRVASWLEATAGENVTLLLRASEAKSRAGLDHLPLTLRIVRSPMRRLVGLDGLRSIGALIDLLPADAPQEPELQVGSASLAAELGQYGLAMERWERIADRLGEPRARARAWLGASEAAQHLERADDARAHLERARGAGSDDPVLLLELDAADAAITRWLEHRPQEAGSATMVALERARALAASTGATEAPDPRFRSAYEGTLVLACVDAMQANKPEDILPLAEEMTQIAAGAGIEASLQASLRRGSALTLLGRLAEADDLLASAWLEARRALLPALALDIGGWLIQTRYALGRLIEAQEVADECEALAERIGEYSRPATFARMWRLIVAISAGDHRAAITGLHALCEDERDPHHRIPLHQAIARWRARLEGAADADEVHAQIAAGRRDMEEAGCTRCGLEFSRAATESLARVGDVAEAARWFEEAQQPPHGDLQAWEDLRARSTLAAVGGDHASLEEAVDMADRLGMGIESIWARTTLARVKAAEGDTAGAKAILRHASETAEETGAATERAHIDQLLRQLGVRTWRRGVGRRPTGDLSVLSDREREIANLIAGGASNPDIARTLFLSRKTVERHVSNILAKLEVKNRAQLAARMATTIGATRNDGRVLPPAESVESG
jgi:DNA-binding CsgD family transcriptional regulator